MVINKANVKVQIGALQAFHSVANNANLRAQSCQFYVNNAWHLIASENFMHSFIVVPSGLLTCIFTVGADVICAAIRAYASNAVVEKTGRNLLAVLSVHPDNSTALAAAGAIGIIASVVQKKVTEHKALQVLQMEASKVAKKKYVETP